MGKSNSIASVGGALLTTKACLRESTRTNNTSGLLDGLDQNVYGLPQKSLYVSNKKFMFSVLMSCD